MAADELDRSDALYCASVTGDAVVAIHYRQNGRRMLRLADHVSDVHADRLHSQRAALCDVLLVNLTATERRTFLRLLANPSIRAVAHDERVSRAAIYARLLGSTRAVGMVAKNPFVATWWDRRAHNPDDHA